MSVPSELKQYYREGRLLPFVGAGISMSVKWARNDETLRGLSWEELVDRAAKLLGASNPNLLRYRGTDLQILEYFGLKMFGRATLTNWLVRQLNPPDEDLGKSKIHRELSLMEHCRLFYTTNYDDFLERSFRLHGRDCRVVAVEGHLETDLFTEVVKFHGDLNHPKTLVLSESDYEERLSFSTVMDFRFLSDVLNRVILFIGYSFRDPNIAYLFQYIRSVHGNLPGGDIPHRAYILVPDPSDFEYKLFHARGIGIIPISSIDQTSEVSNVLKEIRSV